LDLRWCPNTCFSKIDFNRPRRATIVELWASEENISPSTDIFRRYLPVKPPDQLTLSQIDVIKQLCGSVEDILKIPEKSRNSNILPKGRKNFDMSKMEKEIIEKVYA